VEKTGIKRPWKSLQDFHFSHSFNNNKLDDRDHFQQNAKTSVASLRALIGSSRNSDRHQTGMLIDFIGIPKSRLKRRNLDMILFRYSVGVKDNRSFLLRK
jgi:hypothetical protein